MKRKHFIKKVEDFVCKNCGEKVKGSGYTNHCPRCLFSMHVDLEVPGDRKSDCLGLMEPVGIEMKKGKYVIVHQCVECGKEMKNKTSEKDDFEKIVNVSNEVSL